MDTPQAVVVGGGLAGIAAAVTVARAGLRTLHLAPKGPPDRRTSALMLPTVDYLLSSGLICEPAAIGYPLTQIRIIDATPRLIRAPETLFDSVEAGLPAFAWNFPNVALLKQFEAAKAELPDLTTLEVSVADVMEVGAGWQLTLSDGSAITAPLLVGSDGKKSLVRAAAGFQTRETSFGQAALVCDLQLSRPLGGASVEFHYPRGPFTLVPAGGAKANLVWIDDRDSLQALWAAGPEALQQAFIDRSQQLFGDIQLLTPAHIFPLSTLSVDTAGQAGVMLAGEAAHAFPPIGAQGLNLGLRDVADLSSALAQVDMAAPDWAVRASEDYSRRRAADLGRTGGMVDGLFRSLLTGLLAVQAVRAGGLWALKLSPALRRQAFAMGMGVR